MRRSFKLSVPMTLASVRMGNPRVVVRLVLGVLLAGNVIAALVAFKPWGGSAEDLMRQEAQLRQQVTQTQARIVQTKTLVTKVEQARTAGDRFLSEYVTDRATAFSTIVAELDRAAREAGIKPRPVSYELDPVEGSDTLQQMTIQAAYEGPYAGVTKFVNLLDKSPRFLIIENMQASPQASTGMLTVSFRLDTFVRAEAGNTL
jgi:Tfp pilus assembly protein PilO